MSDTMFDAMFGAAIAGGAQGGGFTPTDEQLAAMNSGITATDVQQIETNKTNISSLSTGENITIDSCDIEKYQIKNYYCKKIGSVIFCEFSFKVLQNVTIDYNSAYYGCNATVAKLQIPNNSIYEPHAIAFDRANQINAPMTIALNNSGYINLYIYTNSTNYTITPNSYITTQFFAFEK